MRSTCLRILATLLIGWFSMGQTNLSAQPLPYFSEEVPVEESEGETIACECSVERKLISASVRLKHPSFAFNSHAHSSSVPKKSVTKRLHLLHSVFLI